MVECVIGDCSHSVELLKKNNISFTDKQYKDAIKKLKIIKVSLNSK